jgi:hypothetical protein
VQIKNLIRPGLFPEILLKTTKETQVKNMFGVQKSNKKIKIPKKKNF